MKSFLILQTLAVAALAQYTPENAPDTTEEGQTGTNKCGTVSSQTSMCQNAYLNSVSDFCLYAPPEPGPGSTIGETERIEVSWCTEGGKGTRVMPDGTLQGVHFVKTPDYVQVTGIGDLTKINIPEGDAGGELDPHGADGNGNPIGGLVFSNAYGQMEQIHEWTNFMSSTEFCFRACRDGPNAATLCQHIYDVMGCDWNMPGNYDPGVFEECAGDTGEPMGVYGGSTFHQGDAQTPPPHPAPSSSQCSTVATISAGDPSSTSPSSPSSSGSNTTSSKASSSTSTSSSTTAPASQSNNSSNNAAIGNHFGTPTMGGTICLSFVVASIGYLSGNSLVL